MSGIVGEKDFNLSWLWFIIGLGVICILLFLGVLPSCLEVNP